MVGEMKEGIMEDDRKGTWEDVTKECTLGWANLDGSGGHIDVAHNGVGVAWVGCSVEDGWGIGGDYRLTATPEKDDGSIQQLGGAIKVEHFIPDPEPVIAYKAVIEVNGEWVSTWAGGPSASDQEQLSYAVGRTVTATRGPGVACFGDLESAQAAFPSPGKRGGLDVIPRNDGRLGILEVRTIGEGTLSPNLRNAERWGAYCYPSVKVLSVAWEEEKEWVDVTSSLTASMGMAGYINVFHHGTCVLSVGSQVHVDSAGLAGYRITTTEEGSAGRFKVEKRND